VLSVRAASRTESQCPLRERGLRLRQRGLWSQRGPRQRPVRHSFPASCTCSDFCSITSCTSSDTGRSPHRFFAGPYVTSVGGRVETPKSRPASPVEVSRATLIVFPTSSGPCPGTCSGSEMCIRASTSAIASVTQTDICLLLLCNLHSPGGRGTPDISAQALNHPIILNGAEILVNGTSASTPMSFSFFVLILEHPADLQCQVVAAIISLLNDYRISNGKPTLGFLNPWLYSWVLPGLNDVTSGSNPGCNTRGFPATTGWDLVRSA
jgi:hypothetical protein